VNLPEFYFLIAPQDGTVTTQACCSKSAEVRVHAVSFDDHGRRSSTILLVAPGSLRHSEHFNIPKEFAVGGIESEYA
jgi:hypothetical protein